MKQWLQNALNAADLMQGYVNLAIDRLDSLTQDQKDELGCEIQRTDANGPEDAAALAILAHLLENEKEEAKPPEGSIWVKVDPFDFESADSDDGGGTTYYGGEIRIENDTNVDITINCGGNDRSDDRCFWPTTEAVLEALFVSGVPGAITFEDDGEELVDYCTNWEEFYEEVSRQISPMAGAFYVYRDESSVVIIEADGTRFTHPIPPATKE